MKIAVVGLWHLGTVTAAGLAAEGHDVVAIDDARTVFAIEGGTLPVDEPGLAELIAAQCASGRLRFTADHRDAAGAGIVWITYDTPVTNDDRPDAASVLDRATAFLTSFDGDAVVVVSSQLPVGSVAELERRFPGVRFSFAAVPENLRLGAAVAYFRSPDRVIAGVRDQRARDALQRAIGAFANEIVWMSVESAEVTKHAINAFLATSVTFANEVASVCERSGADAREVEGGLKSDARVGPKAYVRAGEAFAGGTLARDLVFLSALGDRYGLALQQLRATAASNLAHRDWPFDQLARCLGGVRGRRIALLGLVYKPGTDTLRASTAIALAQRLHANGAEVAAYDPAIAVGDERLGAFVRVGAAAEEVLRDADAVVVATAWPAFRELDRSAFTAMHAPLVVDPARFLEDRLAGVPGLRYVAFGRPDLAPVER